MYLQPFLPSFLLTELNLNIFQELVSGDLQVRLSVPELFWATDFHKAEVDGTERYPHLIKDKIRWLQSSEIENWSSFPYRWFSYRLSLINLVASLSSVGGET